MKMLLKDTATRYLVILMVLSIISDVFGPWGSTWQVIKGVILTILIVLVRYVELRFARKKNQN